MKNKKLKVYLVIPQSADCGVGYYRMVLPMWEAEKNGEIELRINNFTWGERGQETANPLPPPSLDELAKNCEWADVVYWARNDVPQYIADMGGIRQFLFEKTGVYKPMILDIDDNIHATRPYNPGYRSYYPNSPHAKWNLTSVLHFDALTVSTENLKELYEKYTPQIAVCPNSMPFKERDALLDKYDKMFPHKDDEIRIGWSGSASHWENLKRIEPVIISILEKYPNTTFYYTGLFGDLFKKDTIKDRVVSIPWSPLKEWAKTNVSMHLDIALAPLTDCDFNRAKSNLRLLEYATAKYPVIASPVEPYKTFTNKEVLFASEREEWFDAIEKLVLDKSLRNSYSKALYKKAKMCYNISVNYKMWITFFKDVLKTTKKINKSNIMKKHQ